MEIMLKDAEGKVCKQGGRDTKKSETGGREDCMRKVKSEDERCSGM